MVDKAVRVVAVAVMIIAASVLIWLIMTLT